MNPIGRVQADLFAILNSLAYCADIGVTLWRPRLTSTGTVETAPVIASKIDKTLSGLLLKGGKAGLAAIVLMPVVEVPNGEAPGPDTKISLSIRLRERTLINMGATGTQKPAEEAAWEFQREIHQYPLGYATLVCEGESIMPVIDPTDTKGDVIYNIQPSLRLSGTMPTRVQYVAISGTAAAVTLASGTSGAAIYYTTDESFPAAGNSAATLYSAPFAVAAGTVVRAAAFKSGLSLSYTSQKTIT